MRYYCLLPVFLLHVYHQNKFKKKIKQKNNFFLILIHAFLPLDIVQSRTRETRRERERAQCIFIKLIFTYETMTLRSFHKRAM